MKAYCGLVAAYVEDMQLGRLNGDGDVVIDAPGSRLFRDVEWGCSQRRLYEVSVKVVALPGDEAPIR